MKRWLRGVRKQSVLISICMLAGLVGIGLAASVYADTIVQGFNYSGSVQPGMIVALSSGSSSTVEASPAGKANKMYGVVIDPSQASVTVQAQGQQVFVANGGNYGVLVSTQNGNINAGDYISISSTNGIGAKATQDQSDILGRALQSFDGKSDVITSGAGGTEIGNILVSISPGINPTVKDAVAIPAPLKRLGESIAGKNVTAIRIYAAMAVFIIAAGIAGTVLWMGIRSGMVAIGRNPLSRHSIMRTLLQVIIVAILVFVIGVFGVYLLLRL